MAAWRKLVVAAAALCSAGFAGAEAKPAADTLIYFGIHGDAIYGARLNESTGALTALGEVAKTDRPTWLVANPKKPVLYAVNEIGNDGKSPGGVTSLSIDPATGALKALSRVEAGGGSTHLALDPKSMTVFTSSFGTGEVMAFPILPSGELGPAASSFKEIGSGPHPRQPFAHAHGTAVAPDGRHVLSADMGADKVFVYRFDPAKRALTHIAEADQIVGPGIGPRHAAFSPNGRFAYFITELRPEVRVFGWDGSKGRLTPVQTVTAASANAPPSQGAEIVVSPDGRFVYTTVRGEDVIITYAVNGKTGALTEKQRLATGGKVPWSFSIDPNGRWLVLANEASSSVNVFKRNASTGELFLTQASLSVPNPTNVTFFPQ